MLVFATDAAAAEKLLVSLEELGFAVDCATSIGAAQGLFLQRGGHTLLIFAPDVGTGQAREVIDKLHRVDEDLTVIVFGDEILRGASIPHLHRIRSFHPDSRAGIGAIQRIVLEGA